MLQDEDTLERLKKCTHNAPPGAKCAIFSVLDALNAELGLLDLLLQESAPRLLTLTTNIKNGQPRLYVREVDSTWWLHLKSILPPHRCIVSVDIDAADIRATNSAALVNVLPCKVPSLESLHACDIFTTKALVGCLAGALYKAYALKELHLQNTTAFDSADVFLIQNLFRNSARLTTLSMTNVHIQFASATSLIRALLENSSLNTLKISTCSCLCGPDHGTPLVAALIRKPTLRSLTLERCCLNCRLGVIDIMTAVASNCCLSELSMSGFSFRVAFEVLMPILLMDNNALRNLSIECRELDYREPCKCESGLTHCTDECLLGHLSTECLNLDLLTQAITRNESLEELSVDLHTSPMSKCQRFFEALRDNTTLRIVTVTRFSSRQAATLCQAIRQSGVQERVNISCPLIFEEPMDSIEECTSFSSVIVDSTPFKQRRLFYRALTLLPRWHHIRDLSLRVRNDQFVSRYRNFQLYLKNLTNLRRLYLDVRGSVGRHIRRNLLMELLSNCRIQKLNIVGGMVLDDEEAADFTHALCLNDTLSEFSLFRTSGPEDCEIVVIETILRHLARCVTRNHTICFLEHDTVSSTSNFCKVHSTVRRNRALAMRAAHFVLGKDTSEYCVEAFRLVRHSPQLLFDVMEMASLDEAEAARRIHRALAQQE
ncbi:hypothetical protein MTO96_045982 [Rhipicephalus appendiculatus]